jgi:hypothetical protein
MLLMMMSTGRKPGCRMPSATIHDATELRGLSPESGSNQPAPGLDLLFKAI